MPPKTKTKVQIVPKNNVIEFPASTTAAGRKWMPVPPGFSSDKDSFDEFPVHGRNLERFGIFPGDLLTVRTSFSTADIKPLSLCAVRIGGELDVHPVEIMPGGKIKVFFPGRVGFKIKEFNRKQIEILGIAIEARRSLL